MSSNLKYKHLFLNSPYWVPFKDFDIKLAPDHVHIFRILIEDCYQSIVGNWGCLLSEAELQKSIRLLHVNKQKSYLVRRYYVRRILSCFSAESPEMLRFSQSGNGKPGLNNIQFNVSHSKEYAIVVVHLNPIGVDIEYIDPSFAFEPILKTCFNVEEQQFVTESEPRVRFYSLWTRKEAILKATGEGLIDDLSSINALDDRTLRMGHAYQITTLFCQKQYLLSLATTGEDRRFKFWHVSP